MNLQSLLIEAKGRGASDVLIMVGDAPAMRVAGHWTRFELPAVNKADMATLLDKILTPEQKQTLEKTRELDVSHQIDPVGRIRCNMHFQRDHLALVVRLMWPKIPSAAELGIPANVINMVDASNGLILICGPTGSGKSTTMASMVQHINDTRCAHVITIEDPIEFMYSNKKSLIEQREVGADTHSFSIALRHVLRQAPDVIVLGELRDLESIQIALLAAETGHLVIASLHSSNTVGAILRMADVFPPSQLAQVRLQLSQTLRMVFAQQLVPAREEGKRVLAYETLMGTPAVQNVLRTNELEQINNMISSGRQSGMISFAQCFREMSERNLIHPDFVQSQQRRAAAAALRN